MENNNIELFNKFSGDLLAKLYKTFPVENNVLVTDFKYLDNKENSKIFFSSVRFLKREGFIDYNEAVYGAFTQARLTTKSLTLLNSIPSSIETKETFGKELETVVKEGKSELIKKVIGELFKASIKLFN